ncbi:MBL fold metallo-hydrolase [Clostridium sp. 'White wine YQ']|uniref:MBL fold metallo-hydrolase n=1 Tax=Clostridium sp. 'White wine YQ' TaxID=3027474 RepID=UPI00236692CF|nr:MBL fold metallo-hydrolase [Clostridium sp. 'White wine YQ']MDD7793341.1 MBL fold metallo-hydrolase [Clostridium sp. 'White wine YQ']
MLNFIGIGSAFNTKLGNNSAYIKKDNSLILIDCGGTVFHKLQELNLLQGIENLYFIITHTHPDHIGSLGDTIFYSNYILKHKPKVYFPDKAFLNGILAGLGVGEEMYYMNDYKEFLISDNALGKVEVEFIKTTHSSKLPCYGFIMGVKGEKFYYSGDSNEIENKIIDKLISGEIQRVYQDTSGLDYEGNGHLYINKLIQIIPEEFRNKVYCMHLDGHVSVEEIRNSGFNVVEILKN